MSAIPRLTRRQCLTAVAAAAPALVSAKSSAAANKRNIKLGIDNFAMRAFGWKAQALIDFSAEAKLDSLFITDLDAFESRETAHLKDLRQKAADKGVQIHLGTWSVCPSSNTFKTNWGNVDEHMQLGIRMARDLGSPVLRVVLGNQQDRLSPGGIKARTKDMVKVLKRHRSRCKDAGIKIAVENHAGDMRARELVDLVQQAGKDFVGVNMDCGNAVWALEDPMTNLEILGPYALTTSLRDSHIWESDKGITVQWAAMGDGVVDFAAYFDRFVTLCPGLPVHIETISGFNKEFAFFDPEFWKAYEGLTAAELAPLLKLARRGKPVAGWKPAAGLDKAKAEQAYQKDQVMRSLGYCKQVLGLGLQG